MLIFPQEIIEFELNRSSVKVKMPLVHPFQSTKSASINDPKIFACLPDSAGIGESKFSPENIDVVLFYARGHNFGGRHHLSRGFPAVHKGAISGRTRAPAFACPVRSVRCQSRHMCRCFTGKIIDIELFPARGQEFGRASVARSRAQESAGEPVK